MTKPTDRTTAKTIEPTSDALTARQPDVSPGRRSRASGDTVRPEVRLALAAARTELDDASYHALASLLERDLDWNYVIAFCTKHCLVPLLYRKLIGPFESKVPTQVLTDLRKRYHSTVRSNLVLTAQLFELMDLLDEENIPVIPYKGPVLAECVYGDISLRQFGDLDIIVQKSHVRRAGEILVANGYRMLEDRTPQEERAHLRKGKDLKLIKENNGVHLEVHWAIMPPHSSFHYDTQRLWTSGGTTTIMRRSARVPSAEDLLLVLCAHGAKHHWERLSWLCDVAELIRTHDNLDWDLAGSLASKFGARRMVDLGLLLVTDLLDAPVPESIVAKARSDGQARILADQVRRWIFAPNRLPDRGETYSFFLGMRERLADRVRIFPYLAGLMMRPTSRDETTVRLPVALRSLYYVIRPVRLAGEYGLRPALQLFGTLLRN